LAHPPIRVIFIEYSNNISLVEGQLIIILCSIGVGSHNFSYKNYLVMITEGQEAANTGASIKYIVEVLVRALVQVLVLLSTYLTLLHSKYSTFVT